MKIQSLSCLAAIALVLGLTLSHTADALNPLQQQQMLEQLRDESDLVANAEEVAAARQILARDPAFVLDMLTKMRSGLSRPMENAKRGIDFGLGRGFSGSQAAKHFMGMAAASFSGGPGRKRKRTDPFQYPTY